MTQILKTAHQMMKEAKDAEILADFQELLAAGGSRTAITQHLMKKYQLRSPSAIWAARKRAAARKEGKVWRRATR